jgi:serine/threonine protein kinase
LDRLEEMLKDRMVQWVLRANNLKFCLFQRHFKHQELLQERLGVAADLADAVAYLHQHNIVHRDLKPSNIGFDCNGTLKLFDFDTARILPQESFEDECFALTAKTGTRRYMSPECGLGERYNCKTDVFGFAILLHGILSLEFPFNDIYKEEHEERVWNGGYRPRISVLWPTRIKVLLKQAWSRDIHCRPSMAKIYETLTQELSGFSACDRTRCCRIGRTRAKVSAVVDDRMNQ